MLAKMTRTFSLCLLGGLAACAGVDEGPSPVTDQDYEALSPLEGLHEGYPDPSTLPHEYKADGPLPALHSELVTEQTAVKSQGRRGVCSIFSTAAHMEHMYVKAGMPEPDFSEQFLQWSAKFEVGSFPASSGSNARYNLQAISNHGIVTETAWPYEENQWGPTEDADCDKDINDPLPTKCFTNGHPGDVVLEAERYDLPRGRWVSTWANGIKHEVAQNGRGVIVGLTFFYQSWNHSRSPLPTNEDYKAQGYVLYPNDKDKEESRTEERSAGHSIYIVGWDDDLEVPVVDEEGEQILDAAGNPLTEKGFYIFKNSWGTGSWGRDNPFGAGYGYLSYRYVREYGSAYTAGVPNWTAPAPAPVVETFDSTETVDIPDNDATGGQSTITVESTGPVTSATVAVNIEHTWVGDLTLTLVKGDDRIVFRDRQGGSDDDIVATFEVPGAAGLERAGDWTLVATDSVSRDTGRINSWTLTLE